MKNPKCPYMNYSLNSFDEAAIPMTIREIIRSLQFHVSSRYLEYFRGNEGKIKKK
jgi:hypothetical protein